MILKSYSFNCLHHEVALINSVKHIFEKRKNIIFIMCFGTLTGGKCIIRTFKKANIEELINGPDGINQFLNSQAPLSLNRERIDYFI